MSLIKLALYLGFTLIIFPRTVSAVQWEILADGLEFGKVHSPLYETYTNQYIHFLRIDPTIYELTLFNSSHPDQGQRLSARDWANREGLTAVINAAMFQQDYLRSVSYMRSDNHVNNPRVSGDKTFLAFDPLKSDIPPIRIIDIECDDFSSLRNDYRSIVQSIRMLSCRGRNVWQESDRRWSIAAIGTDTTGNLLFIHSTAPHSVNEFINILRALPINLQRAMYMEGGSQAQMFVRTEKKTLEFVGNYSSGGRAIAVTAIPNVLGIKRR